MPYVTPLKEFRLQLIGAFHMLPWPAKDGTKGLVQDASLLVQMQVSCNNIAVSNV